jgi:DNA invertase Pin-like site-specific DNA recombinase
MKAKYIRVSMKTQKTYRQEVNTNKFDIIYIEKESGVIPFAKRKEASKLMAMINLGKIKELHVEAVDRLGRNIIDILTIVEFLNTNKVNLYVENIGMYSMVHGKSNPSFKMIISVLGNVAEMERESMLERQKQGIAIAKAKGVYTGRLYGSKLTDEQLLEKYKIVVRELKNGESLRRAAKIGSCSLGTAQKIQKIIKN